MAEARYLRALHGGGLKIVYAGVCPPGQQSRARRRPSPSATWSSSSGSAGSSRAGAADALPAGAGGAAAAPERGGRAAAGAAGGVAPVEPPVPEDPGLDALPALARAVTVDRLDLGFVDILSTEGALDHPLSGPQEELYWRRELLQSAEPPRSRQPGGRPRRWWRASGPSFEIKPRRSRPTPTAVRRVLEADRAGPQRAAVGLPGLRVRAPAGGSPRRRRWAGRRCGSARRIRSAGRTRRSGRRRRTR